MGIAWNTMRYHYGNTLGNTLDYSGNTQERYRNSIGIPQEHHRHIFRALWEYHGYTVGILHEYCGGYPANNLGRVPNLNTCLPLSDMLCSC